VLVLAQEEAGLLGHSFIGTEHILLGLISEGEGLATRALESLDISLGAVRAEVEATIGPAGSPPTGSPPFTPRAKKALELSLREALQLGHNYIGTEHMLLGLIREGEGVAAQVLVSLGADLSRVRQQVVELLSGYHGKDPVNQPGDPRRLDDSRARVGTEWTARVVRAGRGPTDFAEAHEALAELAAGLGLDVLDASRISVSSVETDQGPGIRLVLTHRLEVPPRTTGDTERTDDDA
jgi:ATP-dependent Clp protease ATP-binding subunit ClpC